MGKKHDTISCKPNTKWSPVAYFPKQNPKEYLKCINTFIDTPEIDHTWICYPSCIKAVHHLNLGALPAHLDDDHFRCNATQPSKQVIHKNFWNVWESESDTSGSLNFWKGMPRRNPNLTL